MKKIKLSNGLELMIKKENGIFYRQTLFCEMWVSVESDTLIKELEEKF